MSRTAVVTGGSRGIGLAIARALANGGDTVTVLCRSQPSPDTVGGLDVVCCDITSTEQVTAAFDEIADRYGPVEVLVANAGITKDRLLLRMSDDDFTAVVDTNLVGTFRAVRRAAADMLLMQRGRIVVVSSVVGLSGAAGQANYAASKAGLVGFARSLARELAGRNVTVNVVAPGYVDTDMTRALSDRQRDAIVAQVPLGRAAAVDEVAAAVRFLASDEASYITGSVLPVDGGWGMGH